MSLPVGTVLDKKYKIVAVLGEGGMGTVYKVEQAGLKGRSPYYYAVKELTLAPGTTKSDQLAAIERFNREIDFLSSLKHARIPTLKVPFQEKQKYYFVMEFVPGESLEKMLENARGPLPEDKVVPWMVQICEALAYIHSQVPPIILRDLKPANIMVTPAGEAMLIDFGIARTFKPGQLTNTENLGTISYASPEHLGSIAAPGQKTTPQNPGKPVQTDARSDIYSLGATMYHLLTNYEPDPIVTPTPGSVLAKNPRLRTVQVGGSRVCPVEQVIIKAMQQAAGQRFQDAESMRQALQQCLPGSSAPAAAVQSTIQVPAVPAYTIASPPPPPAYVPSVVYCPVCGLQNRPGARFCKNDGQPLTQGATVAPPQYQYRPTARPVQQASQPARKPIQARPVQPPSQPARKPIQARPVQPTSQPVASTSSPASAAFDVGVQCLAAQQYAEAIRQFKLAQGTLGKSYDLVYNLGRALRQHAVALRGAGDERGFRVHMGQAAGAFGEAIRARSDVVQPYYQLGLCQSDLERYPDASGTFQKALQLKRQDPAIYYQLGLAAAAQGKTLEAEAAFQGGLRLDARHVLCLRALARLYNEQGQTSAALKLAQQLAQIDPTHWEGWYALARAHMAGGEWASALSELDRARRFGPDRSCVYSALAACYYELKRLDEAKRMVEEALKHDPQDAEALRLRVRV